MSQCWGNLHIWTQSATTTTDEIPLSLRCACGALTRGEGIKIVTNGFIDTDSERLKEFPSGRTVE